MSAKYCHQCGAELIGTARYCSGCGIAQVLELEIPSDLAATGGPVEMPAADPDGAPTRIRSATRTEDRKLRLRSGWHWKVALTSVLVLVISASVLGVVGNLDSGTSDGAERQRVEAFIKQSRELRDETNFWLASMTEWAKEGDLSMVVKNCRTLRKIAAQWQGPQQHWAPWPDVADAAIDAGFALADYAQACELGDATDDEWATWRAALGRFDEAARRHLN